ncbi:hypothetical protein HWV62_19593 [Athelia sp. TMB]|nr:hypothetical protein HWV62_19593 [Athelia sp. TMB]
MGVTQRSENANVDTSSDYLVDKGRIFVRYVDMWNNVDAIIDAGMARDPDEDEGFYSQEQNMLYESYEGLVKLIPRLPEELLVADLAKTKEMAKSVRYHILHIQGLTLNLYLKIEKGRKNARSNDISNFKADIGAWRTFEPSYNNSMRHTMGFRNETCGHLLCPASLDWTDENVRRGLRDGALSAGPEDLPHFLWRRESISQANPYEGFLRNDLLVKGYLYVFRGPSVASSGGQEDTSRRRGNATLHNIKRVSLPSIAYVAVLIRFTLSSQPTFSAGGTSGRWAHRKFYQQILALTGAMQSGDVKDLLGWWDNQIFSDILTEDDEDDEEMDTSQPPTFARLMKQHAITTASTSTLRPRPQPHQPQQQAPILLDGSITTTEGSAG